MLERNNKNVNRRIEHCKTFGGMTKLPFTYTCLTKSLPYFVLLLFNVSTLLNINL
jgi:hypothetical protein